MHCQNCGGRLRSTARFCNQCGQAVVEKFGSALLAVPPEPPPPPPVQTPTENLSPKTRTAPNVKAPATLEGNPIPPTDELGLRGTGRQPLTKTTSEEIAPKIELRTTIVDAKPYKEFAPTRPEPSRTAQQATTIVEAPILPDLPKPPAVFIPPPKLNVSAAVPEPPAAPPVASPTAASVAETIAAASEIEYLTPSTVELQSALANKPFFTRMLSPQKQQTAQASDLCRAACSGGRFGYFRGVLVVALRTAKNSKKKGASTNAPFFFELMFFSSGNA